MKSLRVLACLLAAAAPARAAYCSGSPDPDAPANNHTVRDPELELVGTVTNGKLYKAHPGSYNAFNLVHVWGSDYEKGFAHGQLLAAEIQEFYRATWVYMEQGIANSFPGTIFPEWFINVVSEKGLERALDWTASVTAPFTDAAFFDELHGVADGSGTDYQLILRIHMLPELTRGHCSMFGAWGAALPAEREDDALLQLRALDWDVDGPFKDHASVVVYHNEGEANSWANVGFSGFIGSITGISSAKMAISEIGVTYPDDTFGRESYHGIPFIVLLRDILNFDTTLEAAQHRIATANRTCDLILGVGSGNEGNFTGVEYSASVANFITDTNLQPVNDTWHPQIENVVYWGMDWLCPGYSQRLSELLIEYHGVLTPEIAMSDVVARTQTGNLHVAVYDLSEEQMYVSFAANSSNTSPKQNAYERAYTQLDMAAVFAEPAP